MRQQQLMTKALAKITPPLCSQDGKDPANVKVTVKIFDPYSQWTWFVTEYDPKSGRAFGYVNGVHPELGYFSIPELSEVRNKVGLPLERDKWWDPKTTLRQVMSGEVS
jgi:hypothetical protein